MLIHDLASFEVGVIEMYDASWLVSEKVTHSLGMESTINYRFKKTHAVIRTTSFSSVTSL